MGMRRCGMDMGLAACIGPPPFVVWYGFSIPTPRPGYNQQKIPFDKNFIKRDEL